MRRIPIPVLKRFQVIVPIANYYGDDSYLECSVSERSPGSMFLIVQVDSGHVVDVDYGYRTLRHALKVAKGLEDRNGPVITPTQDAILPPQRGPLETEE